MPILDFLSGLIKPVTDLVDGLVTTDEEKQRVMNELVSIQNQLNVKMLEYESQIKKYQSDVIIAEAKGESWLQRNWRPSLMAVFGIIVANNYILAPYLEAMFSTKIILEIPVQMWDLLKLGVGGYIGGRSIEKGIKLWKGNAG
jgi:hypothetical protein